MQDFPIVIEDPVYYCGFNSPKSFGGNSYFIRHPDENWPVDSPKFFKPLIRQWLYCDSDVRTFTRTLLPSLRTSIPFYWRSFVLESGSQPTCSFS